MSIIQLISNNIAEKTNRIKDFKNIKSLKERRGELQNEFKEVCQKLSKKEKEAEQIQLERLDNFLQMTEEEYQIYIQEEILPLQEKKGLIKKELQEINDRIQKVEKQEEQIKERMKKREVIR